MTADTAAGDGADSAVALDTIPPVVNVLAELRGSRYAEVSRAIVVLDAWDHSTFGDAACVAMRPLQLAVVVCCNLTACLRVCVCARGR
jgi:hypothetical protein